MLAKAKLLLLLLLSSVRGDFQSECLSVAQSFYHRGYCYVVTTVKTKWPQAVSLCTHMPIRPVQPAVIFSEELRLKVQALAKDAGSFCPSINLEERGDEWKWFWGSKEWGLYSTPMQTTYWPNGPNGDGPCGCYYKKGKVGGVDDAGCKWLLHTLCQYKGNPLKYRESKSERNKLPRGQIWYSGNQTAVSDMHCSHICSAAVECTSFAFNEMQNECILFFTEIESYRSDLIDAEGYVLFERE